MASIFSRVFGFNDYSLLRIDGYSVKGRRDRNEDSYLTLEDAQDRALVLVCDGVSANPHGDFASSQVIEIFRNSFGQYSEFSSAEDFFRKTALVGATMIMQKGFEDPSYKTSATTLTGFVVDDGLLYTVNSGDSRVYLFRNGKLQRLTKDHSLIQEYIDSGEVSEEQARFMPEHHVMTSYIDGSLSKVKIEVNGPIELVEGDLIFATSDGLHGVFTDKELERLIIKHFNKPTLAKIMVDEAYEAGSLDNITFAYYRYFAQ